MEHKIREAFEQIKAPPELKAHTLRRLQTERARRCPRFARYGRVGAFTAVCAALVLMVGLGGYQMLRTPVSFVSIDVNPSIELALNRYDRVVSSTAYNEEGSMILDGLRLRGKPYAQAIDLIVESDPIRPYLTADSALTFTVASKDRDKGSVLLDGIESSSGCMRHGGRGYSADVASIPEAHHNGMSFGKYAAFLVLSQYDRGVTAQDCHAMTMAEIHNQIEAHQSDGAHGAGGEGTCGSGSGMSGRDTGPSAGHGNGHHR